MYHVGDTTAGERVQDINQLITVPSTSGSLVTNLNSLRRVNLSVSGGTLETFDRDSVDAVTNGASAFNALAPVVFSAPLFGNMFYADGVNTKYYRGSDNSVQTWTPTAGSHPGGGCRLIENWGGRLVLSGLRSDPHNWFMSYRGDAFNFDYNPDPATVLQAIAGNNAPAGYLPEPIMSMCPYDDDTLIMWGPSSTYVMSGDPADQGRIDLITNLTGSAFGRPWCKDHAGFVYFVGQRGGIYRMTPSGDKPERLSADKIEEFTNTIDTSTYLIRAIYDDWTQGCHFFFTPLTPGDTTHIFYDIRKDAFWFDTFVDPNYNPISVALLNSDVPSERAVVLGGHDFKIRKIDYLAKNDDDQRIDSRVYIGPIQSEGNKLILSDTLGTLDANSDRVEYEVFGGPSAQEAYDRAASPTGAILGFARSFFQGEWKGGRDFSERRRASGRCLYMLLKNPYKNETWSFERVYMSLKTSGSSRRKGVDG